MKLEQLLRLDKACYEKFFLLNNSKNDEKLIFEICGSTKNIYKIQIYLHSKKIYCNCPDSKKWAKLHDVVCKHICFLLKKVFKLEELEYFYNNLIFTDNNIFDIKNKFNTINFDNEDYINKYYLEKYKNLKNTSHTKNIIKENLDKYDLTCIICYDDLENLEDKNINVQCSTCLVIIHKSCLTKWFNMNNNTCPKCRSIINNTNSFYKNLN